MRLIDAINKLDKRYGWSLLGFVLAAMFGATSVYTEFLRDHRAQVRFEVISDASVLDVREQLGNLEIITRGVTSRKRGNRFVSWLPASSTRVQRTY